MGVYFIGLIISLIIASITRLKKLEKYSKKIKFLSVLPFLVISAIRYDVGTDYMYRYVPSYNIIKRGEDIPSLEYIFKLLIKLCTIISSNYQILFIITSCLILLPLFHVLAKKSKCMELSILIFFFGGFFFQTMNILRQYIAIVFLLVGYNYIVEKKYIRFLLYYILAISFHSASIVAIIFLFINGKKELNIIIVASVSVVIFVLSDKIGPWVREIIAMTKFKGYLGTDFDANDISYFKFFRQFVIYIFLAYLFSINKSNAKNDKISIFLLNVQALALLCYSFSSIVSLFARVYIYFSVFQLISIPLFISYSKIKNNIYIYILLILSMYGIFFFNSNILKNDNEVVPYQTYFNNI